MFGMYPKKGVIAPGSDADILIWDPAGHTSIGVDKKHHMNMDHSAYEGFEIDGKVDTVLSRGRVIVENDSFTGSKGHGRYLKRGLSSYLN
jgi:dihydropyrimidinase